MPEAMFIDVPLRAAEAQTSLAPTLALLPLLVLWLWCLADVVQADERLVRGFSKQQWIFMVVLTNIVGGLLWLMFGKPYGRRR